MMAQRPSSARASLKAALGFSEFADLQNFNRARGKKGKK